MNDELLIDVFRAYYDARRHKRNTINQLKFEMDLEHNLVVLSEEIRNLSYRVLPSVCFVVEYPVKREIFAAEFRDRVVHHLLVNYTQDIFERGFIDDCYSCRKGYGTSYGIQRIEHHIRSCTLNYAETAYALKMDIQGYFMSINRERLYGKVIDTLQRYRERRNRAGKKWKDVLDYERVIYLFGEVIFNDPTANCRIKGNIRNWDGLPPAKSMFYAPPGTGLPIGNLTSQLFSNIYLNEFDNWMKREMGMKHYGRYVDDLFVIHRDRNVLKELIPKMTDYLNEKLDLEVHPRKTTIIDVRKGVNFLGVTVKPFRKYVVKRTKRQMYRTLLRIDNEVGERMETGELDYDRWLDLMVLLSPMNSYLGYIRQFQTHKLRMKIGKMCGRLSDLPSSNLF